LAKLNPDFTIKQSETGYKKPGKQFRNPSRFLGWRFQVIITGIAPEPVRLFGKSHLASNELVYLASKALKTYLASRIITSLDPGWDQALAKAALELNLPYTVALPYSGRDNEMKRSLRINYYELLSRADEVYLVSDTDCPTALFDCRCWQLDQADMGLVLWDYDFESDIFEAIQYGLEKGKAINNLWQDWCNLSNLRKVKTISYQDHKTGAQVF
jgi:hypothetical protein